MAMETEAAQSRTARATESAAATLPDPPTQLLLTSASATAPRLEIHLALSSLLLLLFSKVTYSISHGNSIQVGCGGRKCS
ncbi:hypothetical protein U9M48_034341 [Paspalum notatum var. saurae]|uniref:Uncharacterized protein n=1 Tax=Paspalum notatum var. saurae TaxID=547442 RepID=A0AAQ3UDD4_PASNO